MLWSLTRNSFQTIYAIRRVLDHSSRACDARTLVQNFRYREVLLFDKESIPL